MPAPHELSTKALLALRRQGGVLTSAELQALLGVSQPTVSRALAPLIHAGQVQKVGAARSQRYVLPRNVPGVGSEVRVMRIDAQGRPSPFARLVPLEGGAFWVDEADGVSARHDGLPWFLDDMRPQGFMGRTFALLPQEERPCRRPPPDAVFDRGAAPHCMRPRQAALLPITCCRAPTCPPCPAPC